MKDFVKTLHNVYLSIISVVSVWLAFYMSFRYGIKSGLFIGMMVFLLLGGFEIIYFYHTLKSKKKKEILEREKTFSEHFKDTEDNPTLR